MPTFSLISPKSIFCIFFRDLCKTQKKSQKNASSTSQPQSIDQNARNGHNPDTSIPTEASTAPLLQSIRQFPGEGDECNPSISVPSQYPHSTQPHTRGDRDAQNREATDSILLPPFTVDHSSWKAKDEDDHGIPVPMQMPHIMTEHPSIDCGGGDVHSRKAVPLTSSFQEASNVAASLYGTHGNAVIDQLTNANELKIQSIANLPRVQTGWKDYETKKRSSPCFPGTRTALLQEMMDWITDSSESRMYVLSGLAGIGKSTVAYTIANQANKRDLLGASFFFSWDEADCRSAKSFFATIAYQLCLFNEEFARAIAAVLVTERGTTAATGSPQEQLEVLILDPLQAIVSPNTLRILIVIDALDECEDEGVPSVLTGLRHLVQAFPSFKVILTTRPQPLFENDFHTEKGDKIFRLHHIEDETVNDDIRLYLKHSLSREQVSVRLQDPTKQWCASDPEIESLVRAAGRLFIIASTHVRFILDKFTSNPAAQMQRLLHASSQKCMPFKDLNEFYTIILRDVISVNCNMVNRYQSVLGAIIFVQHPLPVATLADIINIDVGEIRAVLSNLQYFILLGDDDLPRIYHRSFSDYITNPKRCQDANLWIDPKITHTQIAICCFQIMKRHLKYNILGLGDPARFMSNEGGLAKDGITDKHLLEKIPQQLQYACIYWANHLDVANIEDTYLMEELQKFAYHHILHWFEALSLIRKLDVAYRAIRVVLKMLKPTPSELRQLLSDGLRFISKFYELSKRSALHTYYSALSFTPTDSVLYRRYIKEASHNVFDVNGVGERWDALVAHTNHGEEVDNLQFSLDNTMFASQSKKGNWSKGILRIWDAVTGTSISTIRGSGFAITNDFSTIASYKENAITLYDVNGNERGTTFTTLADILRMAISSESSRLAAIISDGTICLWDSRKGELVGSFKDGSYSGSCLQFSASGARLAHSSVNDVVKLRDGIDGRFIASLDCGSPTVTFSPDGSRVASLQSGSSDLKLWSCEDGSLVGIAKNAGHKLAISADGSLLATRDYKNVKFWSGNRGNPLLLVEVLEFDLYPFLMAFSPDGTLAIVTEFNIKLYNTKTRSFISALSFAGNSRSPVAFSPDGSRLAAGNWNGMVHLWDIRSIEMSNSPSINQASSRVTALALSKNCSRVACGFADGAIELWEIRDLAKQQIAAHKQHPMEVITLMFSSDDTRFASGSSDGTIMLWKGEDGKLRGASRYGYWLCAVDVSRKMVAAAGTRGVVLWNRKTMAHIHTFEGSFTTPLAFSVDGTLLVAAFYDKDSHRINVFDVTRHTTLALLDAPGPRRIHMMAFLPDNLHVVVQLFNDEFLTLNLINKEVTQGPVFDHFMQLTNIPLWHGVPVWVNEEGEQLRGLFSGHSNAVPVLWIPRELHAQKWAQGRSTIVLSCNDGSFLLLRLRVR